MSKRSLHHFWVKIRPISYWYFLVFFAVSSVVAIFALRNNNFEMIRLRDEVVAADQSGKGVNEALDNLRKFVYAHMNTDLAGSDTAIKPPIQLKSTYDRLVQAEKDKVGKINDKVMKEATALCEARFPAGQLRTGRVQCVQDYISKHGTKEKEIPKELYQFDFVSPVWSPDLAGWSLLASGVFLALSIFRYSLERWLKHQLH